MRESTSTATARIRLRLTLLSLAAFLLSIALCAFALLGVQWAVAPFALGTLCGVVALGRMSRSSLALLVSDLRSITAGGSTPSVTEKAEEAPAAESVTASVTPTTPRRQAAVAGYEADSSRSESASLPRSATVSASEPAEISPSHRLWERRFGIAALAVGLLNMAASLYLFPKGLPYTVAWWSFGLSVALALCAVPAFEGGWSAFFAKFRSGYRVSFEPRAMLPYAALGAILLLALLIRLYNLDGFPPGLWFDEADNLENARLIADNPGYLPVFVSSTNLPSLFLLPIVAVVKFAGVSMTAARLAAVAFGLAGIVAIFLMVRHMSGTAIGLVAAFLTAVMRWDIIWSRTGMHGITAPFFAALTAWLTYRALRNGGRTDFAVAGAALGLGMWYYAAYRLFLLVIAFALLHAFLTAKGARKRLMVNVGIMALFAGIVTLPLLQFAASHPDEFFRRTAVTSVFAQTPEGERTRAIAESFRRHIQMFHIEGDPNGRHNIPGAPMLDVLSGLLMLVGLAVALSRWRRVAYIVLPVWMLVMIMPGVLTIPWEAPQSLRAITVIPAVIALVAIGIGFIWDMGRRARLPAARVGTAALIAVLLAAIGYSNINAYFGEQANNPEVYAAFSTDETLMANDMSEQASRGYSPMVSRQFRNSLVASLFGHRYPRRTIAAPVNIPIDSDLVWHGAAVYLEPRESGFFDTLRVYYPNADFREVRPPVGGDVLYYAAYLSREELEAAQGLVERRASSDGEASESVRRNTESAWLLEADAEEVPFNVEWTGALHITHPGEYVFALESDSAATVLLDGSIILSEDKPRATIEPAVGLHSLEVRSRVEEPRGALRLLWLPPLAPSGEDGQQPEGETTGNQELMPIDSSNLYHGDVRPLGLVGRFYGVEDAGDIGEQTPDAMQVTPGVGGAFWYHPVLEGEYAAVWDGTLNVPESGLYKFRIDHVHGAMDVLIDGDAIIDTRGEREAEIELAAGRHRIRLNYEAGAGSPRFQLLWTPPGQPESRLDPESLSPALEYMFRVVE